MNNKNSILVFVFLDSSIKRSPLHILVFSLYDRPNCGASETCNNYNLYHHTKTVAPWLLILVLETRNNWLTSLNIEFFKTNSLNVINGHTNCCLSEQAQIGLHFIGRVSGSLFHTQSVPTLKLRKLVRSNFRYPQKPETMDAKAQKVPPQFNG